MAAKKNDQLLKYIVKYFNYDIETISSPNLRAAQEAAHKRAAEKKTIVFTIKEYKDQE
jgi:hypothetical protein